MSAEKLGISLFVTIVCALTSGRAQPHSRCARKRALLPLVSPAFAAVTPANMSVIQTIIKKTQT